MSEIVRESGGSLSTLYDLFESKEGILIALVADEQRNTIRILERLTHSPASPRETLTILVRDLQSEFFHADMIGMMRLVMTESMRNAELGRLLQEKVLMPFDDLLSGLFRRWTAEGKARIGDPRIAADLLMGMTVHPRVKQACHGSPDKSDEDLAAIAEAAVAMFADHYAIA
jgi:AcrR family transcriptional regulator